MKITDVRVITHGKTESGDDLPIIMWSKSPTDDEIDEAYRDLLPMEYDEVGHVYWVKETDFKTI